MKNSMLLAALFIGCQYSAVHSDPPSIEEELMIPYEAGFLTVLCLVTFGLIEYAMGADIDTGE